MRLCIVSETWAPEINGVAHTLGRLSRELAHYRVDIDVVRPKPACPAPVPQALAELQVPSWSVPGYREVHLGFCRPATLRKFWQANRPDVIYLATQGPLGWSARQAARRLGIPLVAGWHTNFDHYCNDYGVPWLAAATRRYLRHFHNGCALTLVPTHLQARQLRQQGIKDVKVMSRGIDGEGFSPPIATRRYGAPGASTTISRWRCMLAGWPPRRTWRFSRKPITPCATCAPTWPM